MPTNNVTPNRSYPEPFAGNKVSEDIPRLISALRAIDTDVNNLLTSVAGKVTTGAPATVTTLTASDVIIGSNTDTSPSQTINGAAGSFRFTTLLTAGLRRWDYGVNNTAETGSNAGSDFYFSRFSDAGAFLGTPVSLNRSTGVLTAENVVVTASLRVPSFTVSTLPSASPAQQIIYVSNGTASKRLAVSDGTNWRFPDGAVVS